MKGVYMTITPISSTGNAHYNNNQDYMNKDSKNKYIEISYKEFLEELHMEQTEQM
jgi:hypothetical protein